MKNVTVSDVYTDVLELRALIQTLWVVTDNGFEEQGFTDCDTEAVDTSAISHMALRAVNSIADDLSRIMANEYGKGLSH